MKWTKDKIEETAVSELRKYRDAPGVHSMFVVMDRFAVSHLGLHLQSAVLPENTKPAAVLSYMDADYVYRIDGKEYTYSVTPGTVLVDENLVKNKKATRRKFEEYQKVIAYTCAQWMIYQSEMEAPERLTNSYYMTETIGSNLSVEHTSIAADSTKVLSEALLMPSDNIRYFMGKRKLQCKNGEMSEADWKLFHQLQACLYVSETDLYERLKYLELLVEEAA